MRSRIKGAVVIVVIFMLALAMMFLTFGIQTQPTEKIKPASDFIAMDRNGQNFSLFDFRNKIVILHITQLENPLCLECERSIAGQLNEIKRLADKGDPNIVVVTLNLRKVPSSEPGWEIAQKDYGIDVKWRWVEEFEPYPIGKDYLEYWQVNGAFSDPSVLIIDGHQNVAAAFHIYVVGRGVMDGVQTADGLMSVSEAIASGKMGDTMLGTTSQTALGLTSVVGLGIITSFSPCSLALLFTMMMYIGSASGRRPSEVSSKKELMQNIGTGVAFTLGMSVVFLLIGLTIGYLSGFLVFSPLFYLLAGAVLIILGANSVWPLGGLIFGARNRQGEGPSCGNVPEGGIRSSGKHLLTHFKGRSRPMAGFFLGILFSIGWAPCALSLVFPMILLIFALGVPALQSGLLLFAFGLAHGFVVIPSCAVSGEVRNRLTKGFTSNAFMIKAGFAGAVIVMGLFFALRYWGILLW
ncbi:MAG TPA: cytochrome c biogenesis protein CcdA [Methanomassiliicoccales archaeon]|jgi:cytochrome c-type biogenesis protein